ncbi:MAG: MCE family protein [Saprospiraceae bacterium]|nr:MCE family protein [Saprospiraceae bacterium]
MQKGNNVRFSGIQIGSIRSIDILNDTVIEVTMSIDNDFKISLKKCIGIYWHGRSSGQTKL